MNTVRYDEKIIMSFLVEVQPLECRILNRFSDIADVTNRTYFRLCMLNDAFGTWMGNVNLFSVSIGKPYEPRNR